MVDKLKKLILFVKKGILNRPKSSDEEGEDESDSEEPPEIEEELSLAFSADLRVELLRVNCFFFSFFLLADSKIGGDLLGADKPSLPGKARAGSGPGLPSPRLEHLVRSGRAHSLGKRREIELCLVARRPPRASR